MTPEEWLIVAFCKAWHMKVLARELGGDWKDPDSLRRLHETSPFMPHQAHQYLRPVRAFVASEWPKLAVFLCKHEGDSQKVLSVCDQIKRLRANGERRGSLLSKEDKLEGQRNRYHAKITEASNRVARERQLSTQRGAWNVCKG